MDGILTTVPRHFEPRVAKKIFLHKNGVDTDRPKTLVINDRQIRDFTTFLNRATSGIRAPVAVRNIYTPKRGTKVLSLQDLENGKHYVAGGNEHFKKLKYGSVYIKPPTTRQQPAIKWSPVRTTTIKAVSRFRDLPEKPYLIHVFRNGDALYHGARILLPKRIMNSMEHILELVTEKTDLTLPAKRLCNLDGQTVHSVTDIKDGEKYVAIEGSRKFIRLPYTAIDPTSRNIRLPRMRRFSKQVTAIETVTPPPPPLIPDKPKQIKRLMPAKQHKGKYRPFAGRKDIEARNLALSDAKADSIFGGSPTPALDSDDQPLQKTSTAKEIKESTPIPLSIVNDSTVEVDIIDQQPTSQVDATIDQTIDENVDENVEIVADTKVESVIEEEPHTEVHEESVEEKYDGQTEIETDKEKEQIEQQKEDVVELQGETVHNTVDLSVARVEQQEPDDNVIDDSNNTGNTKLDDSNSNENTASSTTQLQNE